MRKLSMEFKTHFKQSLEDIVTYQDSIRRIRKELTGFEKTIKHMAMEHDNVHLSKAQELIATAKTMLKLCQKNGKEKFVPYCLAAIDYLLQEEDEISDLAGFDGFDDDEALFKYVISEFRLDVGRNIRAANAKNSKVKAA